MSTLNLPGPISAYFAADGQEPHAVSRCFAADAVVTDEGRTITGREAIQQWKASNSAAYHYTSQPLAVEQAGGMHVVTSRVTGDFRGSPIDLRYRFRLAGGLIASLEITR